MSTMWRSRWAAVGAAVAITLGAGGIGLVQATTSSGERAIYKPINPCRLADTRPAPFTVGPRTAPVGPAESYTLSGWGAVGECNLPNDTAGLALNVTALDPSTATFLTLYPTGESLPNASHLNPTPGQPPTPNAVNVDLSATGQFEVYNQFGTVNVIVDVIGYYDDHNHDDRYYTETESDARYLTEQGADDLYVPYGGAMPAETTVIGNWYAAASRAVSGSVGFDEITLPATPSTRPLASQINMGAGTTNGTDNDAQCTGSTTNPTAPPGKLCIYVGTQTGISALAGFESAGFDPRGASIRVTASAAVSDHYARGVWAYTSPLAGADVITPPASEPGADGS